MKATAPAAPAPASDGIRRAAHVSDCGLYRYDLSRDWGTDGPRVAFVGLNPSTADALVDDPTIRRCVAFARSWGFAGLRMVNLFAYRATDPKVLVEAAGAGVDPVGPANDEVLGDLHATCAMVVAAWGAHPAASERVRHVRQLLGDHAVLAVTAGGHPRHPLYLKKTCRPLHPATLTPVPVPTMGTECRDA